MKTSRKRGLGRRCMLACAMACLAIQAWAAPVEVTVPATASIYLAGETVSPSPDSGTLAPGVSLGANGGALLRFSSVTGEISLGGDFRGADGRVPGNTQIGPQGGLSGLIDTQRYFFLAGVFLGPDAPLPPAPAALDFSSNHDFASLAPVLAQVFFIGDGRTAGGDVQDFVVPAGATRLFLGFIDQYEVGLPPGSYIDNAGALRASFDVAAVPEPATWLLLGGVLPLVVARRRRTA